MRSGTPLRRNDRDSRPGPNRAMLATRILTAVILVPLVLAAIFMLPPFGWAVASLAAIMIAAVEWANLAGYRQGARLAFVVGAFLIAAGLLVLPSSGFARGWPDRIVLAVCGVATLFWLFVAPPWLVRRWQPASRWLVGGTGWIVAGRRVGRRRRAAGALALARARRDGDRVDRRHRRLLHGPCIRAPQARPGGEPRQDLGRRIRRARGGRRLRARSRTAGGGRRLCGCGLAVRDHRLGGVGTRARRRCP